MWWQFQQRAELSPLPHSSAARGRALSPERMFHWKGERGKGRTVSGGRWWAGVAEGRGQGALRVHRVVADDRSEGDEHIAAGAARHMDVLKIQFRGSDEGIEIHVGQDCDAIHSLVEHI